MRRVVYFSTFTNQKYFGVSTNTRVNNNVKMGKIKKTIEKPTKSKAIKSLKSKKTAAEKLKKVAKQFERNGKVQLDVSTESKVKKIVAKKVKKTQIKINEDPELVSNVTQVVKGKSPKLKKTKINGKPELMSDNIKGLAPEVEKNVAKKKRRKRSGAKRNVTSGLASQNNGAKSSGDIQESDAAESLVLTNGKEESDNIQTLAAKVKDNIAKKKKRRVRRVVKRNKVTSDDANENNSVASSGGALLLLKSKQCILHADITESAVKAVLNLAKIAKIKQKNLFDDEEAIFLQINTIKVAKCPSRTLHFLLAYGLYSKESEICLITSDLKGEDAKNYDKNKSHYMDLLNTKGVTNIKNIISYHQLRNEYSEYELKKRFVDLYDLILVDSKVIGYVNARFGRFFLNKRKVPIPIKCQASNLTGQIESALLKTELQIHSKGDSYITQIGHTKMSSDEIVANVNTAHDALEDLFPGGLDNIRSLHLKTSQSMAVPLYLTLKANTEVQVPVVRASRPKAFKTVKGELSTQDDTYVEVLPSGKVIVHNNKESKK